MPELPEVEVVKRSLKNKIEKLKIKKIEINEKKLRYNLVKNDLFKLIGLKINKIIRRSKFLIFFFNKPIIILVHLGMTGKFFFVNEKDKKFKTSFYYDLRKNKDEKYDRLIFHFNKKKKLVYNDVRKFGFIKYYNFINYKEISHLKDLGPEPLSVDFNFRYFKRYIFKRNRSVKNLLMDQKFISGLGNIYANEILFFSKIKPLRKIQSLKDKEIYNIIRCTKKILTKAIAQGGSSIKDFSSSDGKKGGFQQNFKVYGKKGKRCSNTDCSKNIIKVNIFNRSSFYCPRCQK